MLFSIIKTIYDNIKKLITIYFSQLYSFHHPNICITCDYTEEGIHALM